MDRSAYLRLAALRNRTDMHFRAGLSLFQPCLAAVGLLLPCLLTGTSRIVELFVACFPVPVVFSPASRLA